MDRNRSLDEFTDPESDDSASSDRETPDEGDEPGDSGEVDEGDEPGDSGETREPDDGGDSDDPADLDDAVLPDPSTVEPLAPTFAVGGSATCVDCGDPAAVRWRGGDGYVCADCKEW
ncbi:hypothetical protein [Halobaculum sp. MBLA0143]|uniref:DUF7573 domain-containing protein n=1 Tax=Halobaculum sp. MBLA0143 TaxID=3079933 RepID=UPI003525B871